jgi:cyclopropane fatty-acyl-phospholipid synthase-like methyltransferase
MKKQEKYKSNFLLIDKYSNEKEAIIQEAVDFFKPRREHVFLDVGAGDGKITRQIGKKARKTMAVETNRKFVGELKKIPRTKVYVKKFESFLPDEKFDLILASHVLYYFSKKNRFQFVEKMYDLLNDYGKLCIIFHANSGFMHKMIKEFYPKKQADTFVELKVILSELKRHKIKAKTKKTKVYYKMPFDVAIQLFTYFGSITKKRVSDLSPFLEKYKGKDGDVRFSVDHNFIFIKKS